MKTTDLLRQLKHLSEIIKNESYGKGFVSTQKTMNFKATINQLILNIQTEGLQIDPIIENDIQFCGTCNQKISLRKKRIDKAMIGALIKAFDYVMYMRTQAFQIQQVNFTPIEYGVVNHLVRFGLLYKQTGFEHGEYGVPRKTVSQFLKGEWKVSEYYETDPTKQEGEEGRRKMSEKRITIDEIPSIGKLRDEYGQGLTEYSWNEIYE